MSLTSLQNALTTDNAGLDYEHRALVGGMIALCQRFDRAEVADEVADGFAALHAKASAHFALEESLMREKKYASYEAHKADHERLLDQIRHMMEAYEDGLCATCGVSLRECLESWFAGHVEGEDSGLRGLAD